MEDGRWRKVGIPALVVFLFSQARLAGPPGAQTRRPQPIAPHWVARYVYTRRPVRSHGGGRAGTAAARASECPTRKRSLVAGNSCLFFSPFLDGVLDDLVLDDLLNRESERR